MRKVIALISVIVMLLGLVACASSSVAPAPSASAPAVSGTSAAPASGTAAASHVGYWDDAVDNSARKPFKIVYYEITQNEGIQKFYDALKRTEKKLNVTYEFANANQDNEKFINNLDLYSDRDGFIIGHDVNAEKRVLEVLTEMNKPFVAYFTPFQDNKTLELHAPAVIIDSFGVGKQSTQWLIDHYKDYWGDIDTSKLGFIVPTISTINLFWPRSQAAEETFKAAFPNSLVLEGDAAGQTINAETVYNMISAFVTGHPEITHWFINCSMMLFVDPACRAVETLKVDKNTLITCCEDSTVTAEWDSGYRGPLVSCVGFTEDLYACACGAGLVALMDGRATESTLWADARNPKYGDQYSAYPLESVMLTPDMYKDWAAGIDKQLFPS